MFDSSLNIGIFSGVVVVVLVILIFEYRNKLKLKITKSNYILFGIIGILLTALVLSNIEKFDFKGELDVGLTDNELLPKETNMPEESEAIIPKEKESIMPKEIETIKPPKRTPSAWINSSNKDPFATPYTYTTGVIKNFNSSSKLEPQIYIIKDKSTNKFKIIISGIKAEITDGLAEYDSYSHYVNEDELERSRFGGINFGKNADEALKYAKYELAELEKNEIKISSTIFDKISYDDCSKYITFEIAFEPNTKKIESNRYNNPSLEFQANRNYNIDINDEFNFSSYDYENNELVELIKNSNKMFVRPSLTKLCTTRYSKEYNVEYFGSIGGGRGPSSVPIVLQIFKNNYPGVFSKDVYFEFNLNGSSTAISKL